MNLSPHFTLKEATKSHVAARLGIDNSVPTPIIPSLVRTAEDILEPVRAHFGIPFSPSSWWRSAKLNAALRSKPTSQHVLGLAVDFELPGVSTVVLARWCADNLSFDQLLLEFHDPADPASGWVHCSIAEEKEPRGEILTITREGAQSGLPE